MDDREELIAEYDDREEEAIRADIYCELEWVRFDLGRKPGWTGIKYKELFGGWPPDWMRDLRPTEPRDALMRLIRRWDARFKRERKKHERDAGGALLEGSKKPEKTGNDHGGNGKLER